MTNRRLALVVALGVMAVWAGWRLGRPELIFGISTDDHTRILAAWALREGTLASADVWAPLPTIVTGLMLGVAPFPRIVPGIVNLAWSALAVYAACRLALHGAPAGASRLTAVALAGGLLGGSAWFGWLANSALAEPAGLALLGVAAMELGWARTRADVWRAVLPAALAGACRYEAWAAAVIVPVLALSLPGTRRTWAAQCAALLVFPACWVCYHAVVNADAFGFLWRAVESAARDPGVSAPDRVASDIVEATGISLGLAVAAAVYARPAAWRGLALLVGVELASLGALLAGAGGVHNGPRHHLVLLLACAAAVGSSASGLGVLRGRVLAITALGLHLALQLPRVDAPPHGHSADLESIAVAAAALLQERAGQIVIHIDGDEESAVKALIGNIDRTEFAREDEARASWHAATGRNARASVVSSLARPGVAGVVTLSLGLPAEARARVVAEAGDYVLVER